MSERLRIGLVTPGFSASNDDWCIPALHDLVSTLSRDHEVYVLALRYPHAPGVYEACGATVEALGGAASRGLERIPLLWRAIRTLRREARRRRLQVLHSLWAHEPGFVATAAGKRLGLPVVVSILGGELAEIREIGYGGRLSVANRWLTGAALTRATLVTAGSRQLQASVASHVPSRRVRLWPLGVNTSRFTPAGAGTARDRVTLAGHPAIVHVASLAPVKDQATLLDAFSLARRDLADAHLHIIGEGLDRDRLDARVRASSLDAHVTFHGALPHHHLPAYYRAADVCVLSSRFESQAMVVLEAAACGRLTIGTRVGVLPELAGPEAVVEPGDATALAGLLRRAMGAGAEWPLRPHITPDRLAAIYGVEAVSDRLVELYRSLADSTSAR